MHYPCNYGFIPNTLSDDGDPCDVVLLSDCILAPGSLVSARIVGVIYMKDEEGDDPKIIAVPNGEKSSVNDLSDIDAVMEKFIHFFKHYKDLDSNKWVELADKKCGDRADAIELVKKAVTKFNDK